jgi:hypothetical protein
MKIKNYYFKGLATHILLNYMRLTMVHVFICVQSYLSCKQHQQSIIMPLQMKQLCKQANCLTIVAGLTKPQ